LNSKGAKKVDRKMPFSIPIKTE